MSQTWSYLRGAVTVTTRSSDYHACITGQTAMWGCGRTSAEAIGNLVVAHPDAVAAAVRGAS